MGSQFKENWKKLRGIEQPSIDDDKDSITRKDMFNSFVGVGGVDITATGATITIDATAASGGGFFSDGEGTNAAIGKGATAPIASGLESLAHGDGSIAVGSNSVAIGDTIIVRGNDSAAFGSTNTIGAGANASFSVGYYNTVNSKQSFTAGFWNRTTPNAYYAFSQGNNNQVYSPYSFAQGKANTVGSTADYSFVVGGYQIAGSKYSFLAGHSNVAGASAPYSACFGRQNNSAAIGGFLAGRSNQINANSHYSFAVGFDHRIFHSSPYSFTAGRYNFVGSAFNPSRISAAIGTNNNIDGSSYTFVHGSGNYTSGGPNNFIKGINNSVVGADNIIHSRGNTALPAKMNRCFIQGTSLDLTTLSNTTVQGTYNTFILGYGHDSTKYGLNKKVAHSFTLGQNLVPGWNAFNMGYGYGYGGQPGVGGTKIGYGSFAMGGACNAPGNYAFAVGGWYVLASGGQCFSHGGQVINYGTNTMAQGKNIYIEANSTEIFAQGYDVNVRNGSRYSFAQGENVELDGNGCFAQGYNVKLIGDRLFGFGRIINASGAAQDTFIQGQQNTVTGTKFGLIHGNNVNAANANYSLVQGHNNAVYSSGSFVHGAANVVEANAPLSFINGVGCIASGGADRSFAHGQNVITIISDQASWGSNRLDGNIAQRNRVLHYADSFPAGVSGQVAIIPVPQNKGMSFKDIVVLGHSIETISATFYLDFAHVTRGVGGPTLFSEPLAFTESAGDTPLSTLDVVMATSGNNVVIYASADVPVKWLVDIPYLEVDA